MGVPRSTDFSNKSRLIFEFYYVISHVTTESHEISKSCDREEYVLTQELNKQEHNNNLLFKTVLDYMLLINISNVLNCGAKVISSNMLVIELCKSC